MVFATNLNKGTRTQDSKVLATQFKQNIAKSDHISFGGKKGKHV